MDAINNAVQIGIGGGGAPAKEIIDKGRNKYEFVVPNKDLDKDKFWT